MILNLIVLQLPGYSIKWMFRMEMKNRISLVANFLFSQWNGIYISHFPTDEMKANLENCSARICMKSCEIVRLARKKNEICLQGFELSIWVWKCGFIENSVNYWNHWWKFYTNEYGRKLFETISSQGNSSLHGRNYLIH